MKELEIIYEDKDVLVIRKPAGVPVQSARVGAKDCESLLKNYLYRKNPKGGAPYLGLIRGKRNAEDLPGDPVQCG